MFWLNFNSHPKHLSLEFVWINKSIEKQIKINFKIRIEFESKRETTKYSNCFVFNCELIIDFINRPNEGSESETTDEWRYHWFLAKLW